MITVPMTVSVIQKTIPMTVSTHYKLVEGETYTGEVQFTPSQETQVIQTNNKVLLSNITINPIPSNYGKISYNGSTLTVT
jgi:hypothetical protein